MSTENTTEKLLTAEELAKKLEGPSRYTLLEWRRQGIITAEIAQGRIIKFSEARVREQLRAAAQP